MSILSSISLASAIVALIMGVVVYQKTPRTGTQLLYFMLSILIAVVAFAEFGFRQSETDENAKFWFALIQLSPLIVPLVTLFTAAYIRHSLVQNRFFVVTVLILPALIFSGIDIISNRLTGIPLVATWGWDKNLTHSLTAHLYAIWAAVLQVSACIAAARYYSTRKDKSERSQAKFVALAVSIVAVTAVVLDIGMPYLEIRLPEFGTLGYVVANALIAYAIRYHRLFVLSPVVATDTIIETMSDALFLVDADGGIVHVNKAAMRMFTMAGKVESGRRLNDYIRCDSLPQETGSGLFRLTEELFDAPAVSAVDGNRPLQTFSVAGKSMVDSSGLLLGTVITVRDVTDRVEAENALRESHELLEERVRQRTEELAAERERLSVTLASIADGVITADLDGRVTFINGCGEVITGWAAGSATGVAAAEILRLGTPELKGENPIVAAIVAGQRREVTKPVTLFTRDGTERLIVAATAPIRKNGGEIIGSVTVFRDVTERELMEQELFRAKRLESVALLAGGIAHDFNNMLTGINNNLFMGKLAANDPAILVTCINDAERELLRAKQLATQLLTFAQNDDPVVVVTAPRTLIEESVGFFLSGSKSSYEIEFDDDLMNVTVDRGMMEQVLSNLLINAEQAMPDGGTIDISVRNRVIGNRPDDIVSSQGGGAAGSYVEIIIRDHGCGIPEGLRDKVFDPFFSTKGKGRGLGLSIARSIITRHGGTITIDPTVHDGTAVVIMLPSVETSTTVQLEVITRHPSLLSEPRGHRLLLMDDAEVIRESTARMLRMLGYSVETASDGRSALSCYQKAQKSGYSFDCVLLDLTVPGGMGGRECLEALKKVNASVAAIVTSGYSNDPVMTNPGAFGFAGVLRKPFVIEQVDEEIQRVIEEGCAVAR